MADVLLGQSYYLRFDPKSWAAQQPYPPLGTLYAASVLRSRGHDVALFDAMIAASDAEWGEMLERRRPRVAVIYEDSFNYLSKMCLSRMREAALAMIDRARALGCPVIVSGSDATDHPGVYLDRGALAVALGEGEFAVADLVDACLEGRGLHGIPGVATRGPDGAVQRGPARAPSTDLDGLPRPAWDLVDVPRYRAIWRRHGYYSMNVATTRGCPFHCNWCAKPIYGQRYGVRSVASVVDEIAWLKRVYAPDHLWIVDDVFGLRPGWVEAFAAGIEAAGARVPFRCLMRADQVTPDVARALARAGCVMVWMGAESGSQTVLDAMEKGQTVAQIRAAARRLKAAGIQVGFFLQFGYPGEVWDDIQATLALVREEAPDDIGVSVSYPLPGTRFHERVRAELGVKQHWVDSGDLSLMFRGAYAPDFYRELHRVVHGEFRARSSLRRARARAASVRGLPAAARHAAAAVYHAAGLVAARRRLARLAGRPVSPPPLVADAEGAPAGAGGAR
ncbi:MAG: radical SAM protein [Vicinamibacterales bacterium]